MATCNSTRHSPQVLATQGLEPLLETATGGGGLKIFSKACTLSLFSLITRVEITSTPVSNE